MATFNKFNQFVEDLANALHNLKTGTTDVFMVMLSNTAPNAADNVVDTTTTPCTLKATSNGSEIVAGNGYTKKGISGGTVTGAQAAGTFKFVLGTDPVWTAAGGALATFRYAILFNDSKGTTATRPVIGWWDYGSSITPAIGETFTVDLDQTNGVLTLA